MIVCTIQIPFSAALESNNHVIDLCTQSLERCTENMDIILLPIYSDYPNFDRLPIAVEKTAKRCGSWVVVDLFMESIHGKQRTTLLYDPQGEVTRTHHKSHRTGFSRKEQGSIVFDMGGIRVGFITCFDMHFPEYLAQLARWNLDVILLTSEERGEEPELLETQHRYCAMITNAYVLRYMASNEGTSELGGHAVLISPDGKVARNLEKEAGLQVYSIADPKNKQILSNSAGEATLRACEVLEARRQPWNYRPAGSFVVPGDDLVPYPRICAHRGFNTVAPENTMPAFASAIALGTDEIELDIWPTRDGEFIVCHDSNVERVSDGRGFISEFSLEEISKLDVGIKYSEHFKGLRLATLENVLKQFARQTIFNIHIKTVNKLDGYDEALLRKLVNLIDFYDCREHVYIAAPDNVLRGMINVDPDIQRCCLDGFRNYSIVDRAIELGCKKLQFHKHYFSEEMVEKARAHNINCNVFWSDDPQEAKRFLNMGIETILTNDYLAILPIVRQFASSRDSKS